MTVADKIKLSETHHEMLSTQEEHHEEHAHLTPFWPMTIVFIVLLLLTVFTALTAHYVDIPGTGNLLLALAIAITKALLVALWFMHLKYDNKMNMVVVAATLFGVGLFLGFTMLDIRSRVVTNRPGSVEIVSGGTLEVTKKAAEAGHQEEHNPDAAAGEHGEEPHETAPTEEPAATTPEAGHGETSGDH